MLELKKAVNSPCRLVVVRAVSTNLWESEIKTFIRITWVGAKIHGNRADIMGKRILFIPLGRNDKMHGLKPDHVVEWRAE